MTWGMKGIILSLHSLSFSFLCLLYLQPGFPGQRWRMSEHEGSQGMCMEECVCHCAYERDTSNWIDEHTGHSLQGPVTIMTSNPRIHTHTCTRRLSRRLNILFSGNLFGVVVGLVAAAAVAVCAVVLGEICIWKELSNLHKMSVIDHCILPSHSVTSFARRKSKHFAFSNMENGVGK